MTIEPLGAGNQLVVAAAKQMESAGPGPTRTPEDAKNRPDGHAPASGEVQAVQKFAQPVASTLEFSIDPDSGRAVVKIFDKRNTRISTANAHGRDAGLGQIA